MNGYSEYETKRRGLFSLIVFSLFSFSWLAFFQGHLIGYAYDKVISSLGGIVGNCNRFIMAAGVTAILDLVAVFIRRMTKHPGVFTAMDYLIPSIILGVFTGFDNENYFSQTSGQWIIAAVLVVLVLFVTAVISYKNIIKPENGMIIFTTNLLILLFEFLVVASLGNTDENLHRRAVMEKYVAKSKYEKLLEVGYYEQETDSKIDRLRMQAMFALDSDSLGTGLAERLFLYPVSDIPQAMAFLENSISSSEDSLTCVYLGNVAAMLKRDMEYLDSMDLSLYNKVMPRFFMQALIIAGHDSLENSFPGQYREEKRLYDNFCNVLKDLDGKPEVFLRNTTSFDFRRTYYWYYRFR